MYEFTQFASIPLMSSFGSGTIEWPTLGALFMWTIVAALVGSGLGVLRAGLRAPRAVQNRAHNQPRLIVACRSLHHDHAHSEAA